MGIFAVVVTSAQAQSVKNNVLKVDFDFFQRRVEEVNDPSYISWPITEQKETEKTFGPLTVQLKGNFSSSWYKLGMSAPFYSKLVSDGLVTNEKLELIIKGLSKGKHSLLTFHNTFDKMEGKTFSPIAIYVNEKLMETVLPSNRANSKNDSGMAYINFEVTQSEPVVIRFELEGKSNDIVNQMVVNGFELDTPNLKKQARSPLPLDKNEHVEGRNNTIILEWSSPKEAVAHLLFFGEKEQQLNDATTNTKEFKGKLTENQFSIPEVYSGTTYYWRVDEVDVAGNVTRGNVWSFKPAQLAFPGAEGYGRYAIGGRGGKVVEVTTLNDSGPGSLRAAVETGVGPRTIVFNVSGNIKLESRLVVNNPYITIAGQTAPGEGITITRAPIGLTGNEGIIRFLKVRIGGGTTYDGMGLTGANHSIIDHCSISWTLDESFSSRGAHNITLQRTLISEALNIAGHDKYGQGKMHGYAATIGGDVGSFHHNLLAHNEGRNWSIGGGLNGDGFYGGKIDIRNNVVYNWGHRATDGGANQVNFVNNYYKPGASTTLFVALNAQIEGVGKGKQQYYFDGNVMPGYFNEKNQDEGRKFSLSNKAIVDYDVFVPTPFFESFVTPQSATAAYKDVLSDVGANQPFFDEHDRRIVNETLKGKYTYKGSKSGLGGLIDDEADQGGWPEFTNESRPSDWDTDHDGLPNWWETSHGLNPNSALGDFSETNADPNKDGFTQLEDYLDWMSKPHNFLSNDEPVVLELNDFFKGFEKRPVYSISNIQNGNVVIVDKKIQFTPLNKGLASVVVKVVDAAGDTMTRTLNFYIK
ncbi:MAG: hypothetical protein RLZZ44_1532 [Bacteroidota bacterium]